MASSSPRRRGPPRLPPGTDPVDFLLGLPPEAREEAVRSLGMTDADALDGDFASWAHEGQLPPARCEDGSDWSTCIVMGGRGFGKTFAGAKWIESAVQSGGRIRIALVAATLAEARRVMVEGPSGLLEVAGHCIREWRPSHGLLRFRGGAEAQLFSGHSPELLRGPQHHIAWCDELAKWEKAQETWDMLQLGLRLGENPRAIVTTTPRPGPVLRGIMADPESVVIGGPTAANPHNSDRWNRRMHSLYAGTRLERQELNGELLTDNPGALWTEELLERCRVGGGQGYPVIARSEATKQSSAEPSSGAEAGLLRSARNDEAGPERSTALVRLIIAVDPPTGDGTCGIIACARDSEGRAHLLADHSVAEQSPEAWSQVVADAAAVWTALHPGAPLLVVAESNQGGLMVRSVLRISDAHLRIRLVPAIQGKTDRAAPVARLFEAGKVLVHGRFPALEAQLCGMIAGGSYEGPGSSPDRADAMVWGLTELMLQKERPKPRIRRL